MSELTHEWINDVDPVIPEIGDQALFAFNDAFAHLVRQDGTYRQVTQGSTNEALRKVSCIWSPEIGIERTVIAGEEERVPFFVSCGYHGFFKPSIAEVAACAPIAALQARGFNAFYIDSHVDLFRSGSCQRGTAVFVKAAAPTGGVAS